MIVKAISDTEDKMEKGQICNSIVSLLGRQAAVMKNVESTQNNTLKYILETLEKLEKQSSQLLDSVNLPVSTGTKVSPVLGYSGMSYGITGGTYNPTGTLGMTFSPAVSRNFTYPLEKCFFEQVQDLWKDLAHANLTDNDKIDLLNGKPLKDENKLQSAKEAGSTDNEGKTTPKGRSKKSSK